MLRKNPLVEEVVGLNPTTLILQMGGAGYLGELPYKINFKMMKNELIADQDIKRRRRGKAIASG